jgi:hypothetical protein
MRARFVRGGEGLPSDIGLGKYREMHGLPEEIKATINLLRESGYWKKDYDDGFQYRNEGEGGSNQFFWDHKNDSYTWQGAKLLWSSLFWIHMKSAENFYNQYSNNDDYYFEEELDFVVSLSVTKIDPESDSAKYHGGPIHSEISLRIKGSGIPDSFHDLPDSYQKNGINNKEELIQFISKKIKDLETYITKYLKKHHEINKTYESLNFERGKDPKEVLKIGSARGGEELFNMIFQDAKTSPQVFVYPKGPTKTGDWDFWNIPELTGKSKKYFKIVLKSHISLYDRKQAYVMLSDDDEVYYFDTEFNKYSKIQSLKDFYKYFNKTKLKESQNFERGKDPKRAMKIGRAGINYFQNLLSTPLEQFLKEVVFTNKEEDAEILKKAAELLGVLPEEVRIACNAYDESISSSDISEISVDHDWTLCKESTTGHHKLILSSTFEIYVVHKEYNDLFLMLLGTIY